MENYPEQPRILIPCACNRFGQEASQGQVGDNDAETDGKQLVWLPLLADGKVDKSEPHGNHDTVVPADVIKACRAQEIQ